MAERRIEKWLQAPGGDVNTSSSFPVGSYDARKQALGFGLTEAELTDQPTDIKVEIQVPVVQRTE